MSRIALIAAGLCLAGFASPASALESNRAPAREQAALPTNSMKLARLLFPRDMLVKTSQRAFEFGFAAQLEKSPQEAAVFNQHPGLDRAILDAVAPIIRNHVSAELPRLERRCAEFYAQRFSAKEIDGLVEFYSSPTGSKLIQGMYAGADMAKLMEGVGENGEPQFTSEDAEGFARSTVERILPIFDKSDEAYLLEFGKTALYAKLQAITPELQQMMAEIANSPPQSLNAEIEEVVRRTVEEFLSREQARNTT